MLKAHGIYAYKAFHRFSSVKFRITHWPGWMERNYCIEDEPFVNTNAAPPPAPFAKQG